MKADNTEQEQPQEKQAATTRHDIPTLLRHIEALEHFIEEWASHDLSCDALNISHLHTGKPKKPCNCGFDIAIKEAGM